MKRSTIVAVLFGFFVVSFLLARPALTEQQGETKTSEPRTIAQMQKERIEALEQIVENIRKRYESAAGATTFVDFAKAQEELVEAKLESADKPDERIALLKEQLKIAHDILEFCDKQYKVGFNTTEDIVLRAKAHCLAIEIKLAKEVAASR